MEKILEFSSDMLHLKWIACLACLYTVKRLYYTQGFFRTQFLIYTVSVVLLFVVGEGVTVYLPPNMTSYKLVWVLNMLFAAIEVYVFTHFFKTVINNRKFSILFNLCIIGWCSFLLFTVVRIMQAKTFNEGEEIIDVFFAIEMLMFLFIPFIYLVQAASGYQQFHLPNILLSVSFCLYCLFSLPVFFISNSLFIYSISLKNFLYGIHYFFLILLSISIGIYFPSPQRFKLYPIVDLRGR